MEITDFAKGQAWAILPNRFDLLYKQFLELQKIDYGEMKAQGAGRGGDERPYRVTDGLAVIPITGPLSKRISFWSMLFGGSSYAKITQDFKMAMADSEVEGIVLDIDSPGGVVNGTESVADLVFSGRGQKPIVSFANGMMASAAYWIGSAADKIVAGNTSVIGSIGILMIHTDISGREKELGIKTTYLSAGKYKAMGNPSEPLSKEAKEYFQNELNFIYSIFVDTVALHRDVETEGVLTDMADGRTFIGQQAQDAGLVDEIGGIEVAMQAARSIITDNNTILGGLKMANQTNETKIESVEQLTETYPDLVLKIQEEAVGSAREKIRQEAIKSEQKRLSELIAVQFGEEAGKDIKTIIEGGVSPDQLRAIKSLNPETDTKDNENDLEEAERQKMLNAIHDAGAENPGADQTQGAEKDFMTMVEDYQARHECKKIDAIRAISLSHPEAHEAYIRRVNQ